MELTTIFSRGFAGSLKMQIGNTGTNEVADPIGLLPAGRYLAACSEQVEKFNSDGKPYGMLRFEILEGPNKGRSINLFLRLDPRWNPTSVQISERRIWELRNATGKTQATDTAEFNLIPVTIKVKVKPAKNGYEASNEIDKIERAGPAATNAQPAAQATEPPPEAADTAPPPWL